MRSATKKKVGKDPAYLDWIRQQPCVVCVLQGRRQIFPSEAAHTGVRGLSQKAPDREAIPLCVRHHRTGADAYHVLGKRFFDRHGIDRERVVSNLNERFKEEA